MAATTRHPGWGEPYGDTRYQTPEGQVRLYRGRRAYRWYTPDGRQVGLATVAGRQVRPSSLDLTTRTATVAGGTVHAERQGGQG